MIFESVHVGDNLSERGTSADRERPPRTIDRNAIDGVMSEVSAPRLNRSGATSSVRLALDDSEPVRACGPPTCPPDVGQSKWRMEKRGG